jgi:parvulin-like peptidyl-prolyl isomerase
MKPRYAKALVLSFLAFWPAVLHAVIVERVIAKVNGDIITLSEFEERQIAILQASNVPNEKAEAFLQEKSAEILQQAVDDLLLIQKGEAIGIKLRAEALDQIIEDIKKENKMETEEAFRAELAREGLTIDALRRNIGRSIVRRRVVSREIESKITVSEEELRAEYERRQAEFRKPTTVRLQEIVLKDDRGARESAADVVARARGGEDFGALARESSTAATRESGGDLGSVALDALHSDLRRAVSGLKAGEISDPITLGGSIRIVKVNERLEAHTVREVPHTMTVPAAEPATTLRKEPQAPIDDSAIEWSSPPPAPAPPAPAPAQ